VVKKQKKIKKMTRHLFVYIHNIEHKIALYDKKNYVSVSVDREISF